MAVDDKVLEALPSFRLVSPAERAELAQELDWREYKKGDHILEDEQAADGLYYILRGKVKFFHVNRQTKAVFTFGEAGKCHFFGEVAALDKGKRTATVEALEHTEVLIIRKTGDALKTFLQRHPGLAMALLDEAVQRLRSSAEKFKDTPILNVNDLIKQKETPADRATHLMARLFGSWPFLIINALLIYFWIKQVNGHWETPAFTLLAFIVSAEALFFAMVVLNSQNRQARAEELRNNNEFEINRAAYTTIMQIEEKLNKISPPPAVEPTSAPIVKAQTPTQYHSAPIQNQGR